MSLILNIDTATGDAHVSIARDGILLLSLNNSSQKEHASFLQPAIQQLEKETGITLEKLDAIAFTAGPGSYTGLRVGMASAKGLCYGLNKPLISLNTLTVWAASAIYSLKQSLAEPSSLFCPMIDARRLEVFAAIYDSQLNIILNPCAIILEDKSFEDQLVNNNIVFFGSGAKKWETMCTNKKALFETINILPPVMAQLSDNYFAKKLFTPLVHSQPLYFKDFKTG